jgi:Flp pilus assembly protein TadG
MNPLPYLSAKVKDQQGVTVIIFALLLVVFIGFAALAVDIGHLYVVRNELQNAADAGALAGARLLYNDDGLSVNEGANQIAYNAAIANKSEKVPVDVHWNGGNTGDVERGHWSFTTRTFTPNDSTLPVELWDRTAAELDVDADFINAVRVKTRREDTPAASFFAGIFGHQNFPLAAEAVAYIGFAGTVEPPQVDEPIVICKEAIQKDIGGYTCGVGRMINSGSNIGHQTGGWTNFTQNPCETASASTVRPLVGRGNPVTIYFNHEMGTTGGEIESAFDELRRRWTQNTNLDMDGDNIPDQPWPVTLPVVRCEGNNIGPCSTVVGIVETKILWMTRTDKNQMGEVPRKMEDWSCLPESTPQDCWDSFVSHFNLRDVLNEAPATYEDKTIYFVPECKYHEPKGRAGGENFGILSKIPVLVK